MVKDNVTAALLIIGNEILSGRTQDSNTGHIGKKLAECGIELREVRVVPDERDVIIAALNALRSAYKTVFTTGGIGPTHDDITTECVAAAFGAELRVHPDAFAVLERHYGAENFTPARQKMALIPEGAALIPNPVSAAPGFTIGNVHVMAGVPKIMQAMLDTVLPTLTGGPPILSRTVTGAIGESMIAEKLAEIQETAPGVAIGSYPHFRDGKVGVSLVLRGTDEAALDETARRVADLLRSVGVDAMFED